MPTRGWRCVGTGNLAVMLVAPVAEELAFGGVILKKLKY